jgi:DNA polymerase I-like protein with 3'-5' exonuclease and polymerase domains
MVLEANGITEREVALVYANRCHSDDKPNLRQLRLCRPFLLHDIQRLRPQWIVCVGENAAKAVLNVGRATMSDLRQRLWECEGSNVAVTFGIDELNTKEGKLRRKQIAQDLRWMQTFTGYIDGPAVSFPDPTSPALGFDLEFDGARLVTVGLAWGDKAIAHENGIKGWTPAPSQYCVGHNVSDDIAIAVVNGANIPTGWKDGTRVLDTVMLARLHDENRGAYDLESVAVDLLNIKPWKKPTEDIGIKCLEWPTDLRLERCRLDAWATASLAKHLLPKLDKRLVQFQHRLAAALNRVEMAGVKVDPDMFGKLRMILCKALGQRALVLKGEAEKNGWDSSGQKFEFSNDNHMRKLLFEIMEQEPQKLTEKSKQPAVDKTALILLYQSLTSGHPARETVAARLKYEKLEKLVSTYVVGVDKRLSPNSFLFPSINPLGARTGRRSQSDPNLQNWPKRMRQMIVSRWPSGRLVCGDESQLEPRILAEHAGVEAWQEMFRNGKSLYIEAARMLWKRDIEKDTPLYKLTKSTILGTNYGMEVDLFCEKLATEQGVVLSRADGQYVLSLYHNTFPQLPRFFALQKERILNRGYVETTSGQRRHLPCPEGERTLGFKHMWNEAVNFPIQGDAALITGAAVLDTESALLREYGVTLEQHYDMLAYWWAAEKRGFGIPLSTWDQYRIPLLINEVHDELVVDVPDLSMTKRVMEILKEEMEACKTLRQMWPQTKPWVFKTDPVVQSRWGLSD